MTSLNTQGQITQQHQSLDVTTLDDASLLKKKQEAVQQEDYDTASLIKKELERRLSAQNATTNQTQNLSAQQVAYNKAMEDINKLQNKASEQDKQIMSKEQEIARLMAAMEEKDKEEQNLLTETPSMGDYFSLERRRNALMLKKFQKFKDDNRNYPKNILIYAMGLTESKVFGTRQALKRGRAKLTWNRKAEDIRRNIETLLQRCEPGRESKWKEAIKAALLKEVRIAKDEYLKKLQSQNTF